MGLAIAACNGARFFACLRFAQEKDDLAHLARLQLDSSLQRRARVEPRSRASRKMSAAQGRRTRVAAVASQELFAVAGHSAPLDAHVGEGYARGELVVIRI